MSNNVNIKTADVSFSRMTFQSDLKKNCNMAPCHDKYEILFITEGSGRLVIEGREYPVKAPTMFLISPFEYHYLELDGETDVFSRSLICFSEKALAGDGERILIALVSYNKERLTYYPEETLTEDILSLFDRIAAAYDLPERQRTSYMSLAMSELMVLLSVTHGIPLLSERLDIGERVLQYLSENIDRDITLDTLSGRFFVSKYYLCRAFKRHNGISIHGYLTCKRVMMAKHLIDSGMAASGAAYKMGFGDYSAFYRAFVKLLGYSPTVREEEK